MAAGAWVQFLGGLGQRGPHQPPQTIILFFFASAFRPVWPGRYIFLALVCVPRHDSRPGPGGSRTAASCQRQTIVPAGHHARSTAAATGHARSHRTRPQSMSSCDAFFFRNCVSAIMARSVNCLCPNCPNYSVQVRLIGRGPLCRWEGETVKQVGPLLRSLIITTQNKQATATRAQPATATRNPPARLPVARATERTATKWDFMKCYVIQPFECKITGTGEGIARIEASIHTVIESFGDEEWRIITLTAGHLDSQTKYTDLFAPFFSCNCLSAMARSVTLTSLLPAVVPSGTSLTLLNMRKGMLPLLTWETTNCRYATLTAPFFMSRSFHLTRSIFASRCIRLVPSCSLPTATYIVATFMHPIPICQKTSSASLWCPKILAWIFFLRLPTGQYGPVSQLSRSEERCTGPFNWGEAHCAGEKVKRKIGPFQWKSLWIKPNSKTTKGRGPPRQPGTPRPGSQVHGPKRKTTTTNKRLHKQILVRLNVLDLQWTVL